MGMLRVILAMSVLLGHTTPFLGVTLFNPEMAVQLFFTISGFYMALVLHGKYTGAGGTALFYLNRFLRLYPVYLIVMLAGWAWFGFAWKWMGHAPTTNWMEPYSAMTWLERLPFTLSNWTMVGLDTQCLCYVKPGAAISWFDGPLPLPRADGAIWGGHFRTIEQAWSVGAEIWFYLTAPLLVRLRVPAVVIIAAASAALRWWIDSRLSMYGYFFWLSQFYFFVIGMLLFRWYRSNSFKAWSPRWLLAGGAALLLAVILLGPDKTGGWRWALYPAFFVYLPALFEWSKRIGWDRKLGELSYPIYICHMLIVGVFSNVLHVRAAEIMVPVTLFVSWLLWRYVDVPMDALRQSIAGAMRGPGAAVAGQS